MSSRSLIVFFAALGLGGMLIAALPGGSVSGPGTGSSTCGDATTTFSIQTCPPTTASASDEFNSSTSASNWSISSVGTPANTSSAAFLPYSYAGTDNLYSFSGYRPGWLMVQPVGGVGGGGARNAIGFYRDYTATDPVTVYAEFAALGRMTNVSLAGSIALMLTTSSTTDIAALVGVGCRYNVRQQSIEAFNSDAVTNSQSYIASGVYAGGTITPIMPVHDAVYLHKSGTSVWCWAGTDDGHHLYHATVTKTVTPTRIWLIFTSGESSGGPGNMIFGANFLRIVENQRYLP